MTDIGTNEPEIMIVKKNHKQGYVVSAIIVLIILLIVGLLYKTGYLKIKGLPQVASPSPNVTTNIAASPPPINLQSCNVKKEGNPLIDDLLTLEDGSIFGTYRGNVLKVTKGTAPNEMSILLISPKGDQQYSFTLTERPRLVYNTGTFKDLTLKDIKPMDTLLISFSCDPEINPIYKIQRVAITNQ